MPGNGKRHRIPLEYRLTQLLIMHQEVWKRLLLHVLPQPKAKVRTSLPSPVSTRVWVSKLSQPYEPWARTGALDSAFRHQAWQEAPTQDEPLDSIEFKRALRQFGIK